MSRSSGGVITAAVVVVAALLGIAVMPVAAESDPATGAARARTELRAQLERDLRAHPSIPGEAVSVRAPGLDVAVARGDADIGHHTPLRVDTPFRIASVTKTFVAVSVLRLVEQGRIELDAPIVRFLSRESLATLARGGYDADRITVRQLLDHTSGLFDYAGSDAYDTLNTSNPGHRWTRAEQLAFAVDHGAPVGAPGAVYRYADTGYILLGELLERTTGRSLAAAVRDEVGFGRLGLGHTWWETFEVAPSGNGPLAHQYYDTTFDGATLDPSFDLFGGGGLVSTVGDVSRFFRALFDGRVFERDATLDTMLTVPNPARDDGAALGIFRWNVDGVRCWGHPGYWGTVAAYCPARRVAYALTTDQADEDAIDTEPLERTIVRLARDR
jgi:D-alanyl-D-alanine carboxypeptidase